MASLITSVLLSDSSATMFDSSTKTILVNGFAKQWKQRTGFENECCKNILFDNVEGVETCRIWRVGVALFPLLGESRQAKSKAFFLDAYYLPRVSRWMGSCIFNESLVSYTFSMESDDSKYAPSQATQGRRVSSINSRLVCERDEAREDTPF